MSGVVTNSEYTQFGDFAYSHTAVLHFWVELLDEQVKCNYETYNQSLSPWSLQRLGGGFVRVGCLRCGSLFSPVSRLLVLSPPITAVISLHQAKVGRYAGFV